ncbi:MAG TPA: phosphatase PAP2 family protein [Flavobacteriia bacterium]|nr:phosphatase PAP2 family protein [Flavobacteriia bacterium]
MLLVQTTFWDKLIQQDREVLLQLNALGSNKWDAFWLFVTNQFNWLPLFLFLLYLIFKAYGWKKGLLIVFITALLVTFSDQLVNLIKNSVMRLRPNNDLELKTVIRALKHPRGYSFVSGHSTTSFAVTVFLFLLLRKYYKYIGFLFIWPILFAYSRIYCGVHFPIDIFMGMLLGITIGITFYKITIYFLHRKFEEKFSSKL